MNPSVNDASTKPICQHCRKKAVTRPKKLCWTCYYTPEVVALYPSTSPMARRGVGEGKAYRRPTCPTTAPPGTKRKMAVMAQRVARGETVDHPEDVIGWTQANERDYGEQLAGQHNGARFGLPARKPMNYLEMDAENARLLAVNTEPGDPIYTPTPREPDALHDDYSELDAPEH